MKKAQVTIFIIGGVVIIAAVILFVLFRQGIIPGMDQKPEENPRSFLETCIEDKLIEAVELISSQGGYVEALLFKSYDDKNISYLCYNKNNYFPCIVQEPMLFQHLKDEIHTEVKESVADCFDSLALSLEKRAYVVEVEYNGFEVNLLDRRIEIELDANLILTKGGETSGEEDFTLVFLTRFYNLGIVAQEIISQEAEYCNFNQLGYMMVYPDVKIEKRALSDQTTIYHLSHKKTMEEFWFAVRSCALPGGL